MKTMIMTILMLAPLAASFARETDGGSFGGGGGTLAVGPNGEVPRRIYEGVPVSVQASNPKWACWTRFKTMETATYYCPSGTVAQPIFNNPRNGWSCNCSTYEDPRYTSGH